MREGESRTAPSFGLRNSKGEQRSRLEVNQQIGLRHVNSEIILGHPGGKNLQAAGIQRARSREQYGAGGTSLAVQCLRLRFPMQGVWV